MHAFDHRTHFCDEMRWRTDLLRGQIVGFRRKEGDIPQPDWRLGGASFCVEWEVELFDFENLKISLVSIWNAFIIFIYVR